MNQQIWFRKERHQQGGGSQKSTRTQAHQGHYLPELHLAAPSLDSIAPCSTSHWSPKALHPGKGHCYSPCCSCQNPSVLLDSCPLLKHALRLGKQQILLAVLSKYSNWSRSHSASTHIWATVTLFGCLQESQAPRFSAGIPVPCSKFLREWEESQRENLTTLMPWFSDSCYHCQCHTCGFTVAYEPQGAALLPALPGSCTPMSSCFTLACSRFSRKYFYHREASLAVL